MVGRPVVLDRPPRARRRGSSGTCRIRRDETPKCPPHLRAQVDSGDLGTCPSPRGQLRDLSPQTGRDRGMPPTPWGASRFRGPGDLPFAGSTVRKELSDSCLPRARAGAPCRMMRRGALVIAATQRPAASDRMSPQMPPPPLGACRFRGLGDLVTCPPPVQRRNLRGERSP